MTDLLNLERLEILAKEASRDMTISHVCLAALSIESREGFMPDQEEQFLSYLSKSKNLSFGDEMIQKCRTDFEEGQAYLYGGDE